MDRKKKRLSLQERSQLVREKRRQIEVWRDSQRHQRGSVPPNDVRTALAFAEALKEEHAEGKLTDAERSSVVLAGALQQLVRLWGSYRADDPEWFEQFTAAIERVKR